MSGMTEERLKELEELNEYLKDKGYHLGNHLVVELIAEIRRLREENERLGQELNGTDHKHGYKGMYALCNSHVASLNSKISKLEKQLKGIGAEQFYSMRQRFWDEQKKTKELAEALRKAKAFYDDVMSLTGNDYQVLNYHLNGDTEPLDGLIDDSAGLDELFGVLRKYGLEGETEQ